MTGGCGPETGWVGAAGTAAAARRWRSRWRRETGRRSAAAAGWVGSCDAGMTTGSGYGSETVGDGGAAVAAADVAVAAAAVVAAAGGGGAASVGAAADAGAGSSVMR